MIYVRKLISNQIVVSTTVENDKLKETNVHIFKDCRGILIGIKIQISLVSSEYVIFR